MLGKVARWLRLLGFDTFYHNRAEDSELAAISHDQERWLLTKDCELAGRCPGISYLVRSGLPGDQIREIRERFELRFFSSPPRCSICNSELTKIDRESVREQVQPYVLQTLLDFTHCPLCHKVYWNGTHWSRLRRMFETD